MSIWPRSLFERTAALIAGTLILFFVIAWQAAVWSVAEPAANITAQLLTQRAKAAIAARQAGLALPLDTRFERSTPQELAGRFRGSALIYYIETIESQLKSGLNAPETHLNRARAPFEIWVKTREFPEDWLVLSWRLARPRTPLVALGVLGAASLIVLGGAALSARRLTAPLAGLAVAAAQVAEGGGVQIRTDSGPSEVRSLAVAIQSMSHRLAELDEQRELMLGGISHDLRTPLARIRVAIELLENENTSLLEEMALSVEEMDHMIGQFLHYVRSNYREAPARAVLDDLVRSSLATYALDERLRLELGAPLPCSFAVECVRHTLLNLIQNALEYGRAPITVRTSVSNQTLTMSVEDHGAGLNPMQWQEALQPFRRLQSQPSKGHSGLGLALVDRLVRSCGGTLVSQQASGGFLVKVSLPLA